MCFESSTFMIFRNGKLQDKKHLKFLSKHFAENGKEKLFPNDSSFLNNLKNAKQILSLQSKFSKFLQTYLLACSNVPHFSTKKKSVIIFKRSHRKCSVRKGILRNFAKFTGKHLCQSHFFKKEKKETLAQVFPVNFAKFLRTPFLQNTSGRLLLHIGNHKLLKEKCGHFS